MKQLLLISFFILLVANSFAQQQEMDKMWGEQHPGNGIADTISRGQLFTDGNYAMFIHWGIYSQLANKWKGKTYYDIGEWIMNKNMAGIPVKEYMETAKSFNPVNFDASKIVGLAQAAGMKYIIITSKHHDGFAMFHSKVNSFNIVDATPFKRDPMKELAEECKKAGLGFGFYYSQNQDWTAPGGAGGPKTDENGNPTSFDDFMNNKCLPQVEEITTNYGDIVLVWFDTPGRIPKKDVKKLVDIVRKNQPDALVSGRVGHGMGDYQTFGDMEIPFSNIEGMWETVDVTNDSWGYAWYDNNWKSPKHILENVISTVARGGTYMLNVGPKGDGTIPEAAEYSLRKAGEWIKKYPEVIYAAEASPWGHRLPWGDITKKGNKLFLAVYKWPNEGKIYLPGFKTKVSNAILLDGETKLTINFSTQKDWLILDVPCNKPEKLISVIELTVKEDLTIEKTQPVCPEYETKLSTYFASVQNCSKTKKKWMEKFGEWKHIMQVDKWKQDSEVTWEVDVFSAGYYDIELNYAGTQRVVWKITSDEGEVIQNQQNACSVYSTYPIGWIKFKTPGKHKISVSLIEGDFDNTSLESILIKKVE